MSQSMESYGPVSVDHFHGRSVEEILDTSGHPSEGEWAVKFEGGGMIVNFDTEVAKPPEELVGQSLTLTVLGAQETVGGNPATLLYFGNSQDPRQYVIKLNPMEYAISDDAYTDGNLVYAQRSEANMEPEVPPEDADRLQDGPEQPNG